MKFVQTTFNVHIPTGPLFLIAAGSVIVGIGVSRLFSGIHLELSPEAIEKLRRDLL